MRRSGLATALALALLLLTEGRAATQEYIFKLHHFLPALSGT